MNTSWKDEKDIRSNNKKKQNKLKANKVERNG